MKINFTKIQQVIKQARKRIFIGLAVLVLVIVIVVLLIGKVVESPLVGAAFYYKVEGKDAKLFYIKSSSEPKYLITILAEESDANKYKVPRHSYVSHNGNILVYFEKTGQIPLGVVPGKEDFTAYRIIYKPKYVNLKSGSIKEINQDIDAGSLVFSPNDKEIAWVLSVKESTIEELESAGKKREIWISNSSDINARRLAILDEKVVLLQRWYGDYIYFWAVKGVGYYSLGNIDVKTGRVKYIQPKFCSENLSNCQNFSFSSSGEFFIYEAGLEKDGKKGIEMFVESFDGKKSWQILVKNYISERLWMPDEKNIIYTEQETILNTGVKEKVHLVNLETKKDEVVYTGSYVSQLFSDASGKYLYFIEKESDEKFNLVRLNIQNRKTEILESGPYNQLQIFSGF